LGAAPTPALAEEGMRSHSPSTQDAVIPGEAVQRENVILSEAKDLRFQRSSCPNK
jgi:hypothetical protein